MERLGYKSFVASGGDWGDPVTEQPFNRIGTKLDLSDPQVRIDLWKTRRDDRFAD